MSSEKKACFDLESNIMIDKEDVKDSWKMNTKIVEDIVLEAGWRPKLDLFADNKNKQFEHYVSKTNDKEAWAVDAYKLNWKDLEEVWINPPFRSMNKVVEKFIREQPRRAIIVGPIYRTQTKWIEKLEKLPKHKRLKI